MKIKSPRKMAFSGPRRTGLLRYLIFAVLFVLGVFYLRNSSFNAALHPGREPVRVAPISLSRPAPPQNPGTQDIPVSPKAQEPVSEKPAVEEPAGGPRPSTHPIDTLIQTAEETFEGLLAKESHDLNSAAAAYRKRRGRHPPPGFDKWFNFARENNAVMVEDFFDQIYDDLGPLWGLEPKKMRKEASAFEMTINIRDHIATAGSDWFWTQIWLNLIKTIEHMLPDMDLALNAMDEPRIITPWEDINKYMAAEKESRIMPRAKDVVSENQKLGSNVEPDVEVADKSWETSGSYWNIAVRGCPPDSLARKAAVMLDHSETPPMSLAHASAHTYQGYVSNFTLSTDFCNQPDLQALHGMMIEPLSISSTRTLFPMFGGSKLLTNNEILLPAPMYWNNEERFSGGDYHGGPWADKTNKAIWRGVATGGKNRVSNWKGFQRHRFVSQTNATEIANVESWKQIPQNWAMPASQYNLAAQQENRLSQWTAEWSDTGFVDLNCEVLEPGGTCIYTSPYYSVLMGMKMSDQFDRKYLPDIDGNSFSGRYRGFLMSTSLPIKATVFREWHDSRLVPWKHFAPMDNRFLDFWGIMEYFLGYEGKDIKIPGHDKEAEKIALDGQEWANKVLRPEDMQIYVHRVLLEYARVTDDRRNKMGWVQDLLDAGQEYPSN